MSLKRKLLITQLDEHLALLHKSVIALDYSYEKCRAIGEKRNLIWSSKKVLFFDVLRYVPEIKKIINNVTAYNQKQFSSIKKPDEEI